MSDNYLTNRVVKDYYFNVAAHGAQPSDYVLKFGRNGEIDIAAPGDIYDNGTATGGVPTYPFLAAAAVHSITGAAADASPSGTGARTVEVQGLDANYAPIVETVTMAGAGGVNTSNAFLRIYRMRVLTAGSGAANAGDIDATAGTVTATIKAGFNQTLMAVYTVPAGKTAYVARYYASLNKNGGPKTASCDVELLIRPFGSVFQIKHHLGLVGTATTFIDFPMPIPLSVAAKSDIKLRAHTDTDDTEISGGFDIVLIG